MTIHSTTNNKRLPRTLRLQVADLPVVHIEGSGGRWVRAGEALFLDPSSKALSELLEALLREGIPLVCRCSLGVPLPSICAVLDVLPFSLNTVTAVIASHPSDGMFDASRVIMLAQAGQGMPTKLLEACLQRLPGTQKLSPGAVRAQLGSQPLLAARLSAPERTQVPNALCCLRPGSCHTSSCMRDRLIKCDLAVLMVAAISCFLLLLSLRCSAAKSAD